MQCTFIVLSNELLEKNVGNEIASMIGDTNLFISRDKNVENDQNILSAEVEIMVAEESQRGKKFGFNALCLMMNYGIEHLKINQFEAKIKCDNVSSIKLFEKLGFIERTRSEIFKEITYTLDGSNLTEFRNKISTIVLSSKISKYKHE